MSDYDPDDHLLQVVYHPPMAARDAVQLTQENWDDMTTVVSPQGPVLVRPDFSEAQVGDYAVKVPDTRQLDQTTWVVMPASWISEI